jgi:NAD+ synthase
MQDFNSINISIITFIKDIVKSNNFNGVVLGLSGGIDSAVAAYCAAQSLGSKGVLGILLPDGDVTPQEDIDDALKICKILKIDYKIIYVNKVKESFLNLLEYTDKKLVKGNLVARIRMCILYYYANLLNRLVLGTTNRTEILIGYFTKYGDGASDLSPLADLYKTQIKELARFLNIPTDIVDKKSSARLWENQQTEEEIGLPFEQLDSLLSFIDKQDLSNESVQRSLQKEFPSIPKLKTDHVLSLIKKNKHKLKAPSICHLN